MDPTEFPDYIGSGEGHLSDEEMTAELEHRLEASPFIRRVEVNEPVAPEQP